MLFISLWYLVKPTQMDSSWWGFSLPWLKDQWDSELTARWTFSSTPVYHHRWTEKQVWQCVCSVSSVALWGPHGMQHARLPCPSPTPRACSNLLPMNRWCHPTISSSVIPFSSCLQSFPASGSFPRSLFFASGGLSIGVSASASVLSMKIQYWFPLGLTGLISLQCKDSQESSPTPQFKKHQFFGTQLSLWFTSHIHTWLREKPYLVWKFLVHVLLKPGLENFEHYFASMWDECNCAVVWTFFGIAFLWDWNENWPFPVLGPLLSFPNLLSYWMQHFHSIIF